MKKEELLKLCKYYKGEKDSPFAITDDRDMFWSLERNYIENTYYRKHEYWEKEGVEMAKDFPAANAVLNKYNNIAIKGMIANMVIMSVYNDAGGGVDFILDYGK